MFFYLEWGNIKVKYFSQYWILHLEAFPSSDVMVKKYSLEVSTVTLTHCWTSSVISYIWAFDHAMAQGNGVFPVPRSIGLEISSYIKIPCNNMWKFLLRFSVVVRTACWVCPSIVATLCKGDQLLILSLVNMGQLVTRVSY